MQARQGLLYTLYMACFRIFLALVLSASCLASRASKPSAEIKYTNLIVEKKLKNQISKDWADFLKSKPNILYKTSKDGKPEIYKSDQRCVFNGDLLESAAVNLETLKLENHQQNFNYNLAIIEFLRQGEYKFPSGKKKPDQKIKLDFRYYSF